MATGSNTFPLQRCVHIIFLRPQTGPNRSCLFFFFFFFLTKKGPNQNMTRPRQSSPIRFPQTVPSFYGLPALFLLRTRREGWQGGGGEGWQGGWERSALSVSGFFQFTHTCPLFVPWQFHWSVSCSRCRITRVRPPWWSSTLSVMWYIQ